MNVFRVPQMLRFFPSLHAHNKLDSYIILSYTQNLHLQLSSLLVKPGNKCEIWNQFRSAQNVDMFFLSSYPHIKFHFFSSIISIEFQHLVTHSLGSFKKHLKKDVEICDQFCVAWIYNFLIFLTCTQQVPFLSILLHFIPKPWKTWLRSLGKHLKII